MIEKLRCLWCALLLIGVCAAQPSWFVDGRRGADVPNGGSAANPWKTIGYALATMPVPRPPGFHVLYVAGGQVYGAATNGETFPIAMRDAIAVVGVGMPVVDVPASTTAFVFDPQQSFGPTSGLVGVVVQADPSAPSVTLGSAAGASHAPSFLSCRLTHVHVTTNGADAPTFVDCTFWGTNSGGALTVVATGAAATCRPRIVECNVGVSFISDAMTLRSFAGAVLEGEVVGCQFEGTARFVATSTRVAHCAFRAGLPVDVIGVRGGGTMVIEHCLTSGDGTLQVDCGGTESSTLEVRDCTLYGGSGALFVTLRERARLRTSGNLITGSYQGLAQVRVTTTDAAAGWHSSRDRFIGGSLSGLDIVANGSAGEVRLESGVVRDGAFYSTSAVEIGGTLPITLRGMTIVNNSGNRAGLHTTNPATVIDHCVFADNLPLEVTLPAGVVPRYSLFKTQSVAGPGNLNLVDPQLLPGGRLAPSSPCIDAGDSATPMPALDLDGDPRVIAAPAARPDLGADEYVPAGALRPFGTRGYAPGGFAPVIGPAGAPVRIGSPLTIDLAAALSRDGLPALGAALILGGEAHPRRLLSAFNVVHLDLFVPLASRAVDAQGGASVSLTLPNDTALVGRHLAAQWFVATPAFDLASTQALRITCGR